MSAGPDVDPAAVTGEPAEDEGAERSRLRRTLRAPATLVRLVKRDPLHIPERLTIFEVDRQADAARAWARRVRESEPDTPAAVIADEQRRKTISTARLDGAVAGTPFFIALVPAYVEFLRQEVRFHLRVAALYGHDPADPRVAADFLVLRRVHKDTERAAREIATVRATPLPPAGERTPLKSWYQAVVGVLIVAGFMGPPGEGKPLRPQTMGSKAMRAVRFTLAGLIWAMTWVLPVTFMIVMSWTCESDARRFGERVVAHYGDEGDDVAVAMARADRRSGGNRMVAIARSVLVILSIGLPIFLMAGTIAAGRGPLGVNVPEAGGALAGLALVIGLSVTALRS